MENSINKTIEVVAKAMSWEKNIKDSDPFVYRRGLIDTQRELEDLRFAVAENCSVAAFGESQMGKSYLISALLSEPGVPFMVRDGFDTYNFIDEINPSAPNSSVEATGVVTRFSTYCKDTNIPEHYLKVRMLSVADLVLVLAEAYYVQVNRVIRNSTARDNHIAECIKACQIQDGVNVNSIITESDIVYIEDYIRNSSFGTNCEHLLSGEEVSLFPFLIKNVRKLSNSTIISLLTLIWNENESFNKLFRDLLETHRQLNYQLVNYVEFKSVLRKHGSLLDVARLDEMYSQPEAVGKEYLPDVMVKGQSKPIPKSFLSALIAELSFNIAQSNSEERKFLDYLDLLDFPGLRPDQKRDEEKLEQGKNLATVFRRGKVTYLFNKYSKTKRISSLLFCHNNNQSNQCTMGPVLQDWVKKNVGIQPSDRSTYVRTLTTSPLFVISTWFNKDLEYNDETRDADLNERWNRRFKTVLSKEVLQSVDDSDHWFNSWTDGKQPFNNMFVLRDFRFSRMIFSGYDPTNNREEEEAIAIPKYPDYLDDLKKSFVGNDFVREHFGNPDESWENAARPKNDGTKLIIRELNKLAPNADKARKEKFKKDLENLKAGLYAKLDHYYHPENPMEQIKKAKKDASAIVFNIDARTGSDPYFFGKLLDAMMIPQRMVFEKVFSLINGNELELELTDKEAEIFMAAGLDTNKTKEENLKLLCDYLGVDTNNDCKAILETMDIDIERLLKKVQMLQSRAEKLVRSIEQLWYTEFLNTVVASQLKPVMPLFNVMLQKLYDLYDKVLNVRSILTKDVQKMMDSLRQDKQAGIIADYLTMSLNRFVTTLGFCFMDALTEENLERINKELNLNVDMDLIKDDEPSYGIDFLTKLDEVKAKQKKKEYLSESRNLQKQLPQYRNRWKWQHRLRVAFALQYDIKNYDIVANEELKKIRDSIYS